MLTDSLLFTLLQDRDSKIAFLQKAVDYVSKYRWIVSFVDNVM